MIRKYKMIGDFQFTGQYGIFYWKYNVTEFDDQEPYKALAMQRLINLGDRKIEEIKEQPKETTTIDFNQHDVKERSEDVKENIENVTPIAESSGRGTGTRGRPKKPGQNTRNRKTVR